MELQLNYDKYKRAAAKYAVLYNIPKKADPFISG